MTFTELRTEIMDRLNLSSSDASTRVGRAINRKYRLITSAIGLQLSRRATLNMAVTMGVSTVVWANTEKVINVYNRTSTPYRALAEVTLDELQNEMPFAANDAPSKYAIHSHTSDTVTILLNRIPQTAFTLYADVHQAVSDLSGSNEPAFPESFHDIIIEGVMADELRKMEKPQLAAIAQKEFDRILSDLRMWIAKSNFLDIYQGKHSVDHRLGSPSGAGGGGSVNGATSYTQTGLITFDRDPSAPFAVTSGSAKVDNLNADLLDGYSEAEFAKLADSETVTGSWTFTSGINAANGSLVLPQTAAPGQTAEGNVSWDTNDDLLTVGTGSGRKTMVDTDSTQTLTNKSIVATQLTGTVSDARLSSNVPLKDGTNAFTGANSFATNPIDLLVGQIAFPASQNASGGANVLDDYEEGTWTPAFGGTGGQSGQVYSLQSGIYTKIGRQVTVYGRLTLSTLGTITTAAIITGLPFTANATQSGAMTIGYWANMTTSFGWIGGYIEANTTRIVLQSVINNVTGTSNIAQGDMSATTDMIISGTYFV